MNKTTLLVTMLTVLLLTCGAQFGCSQSFTLKTEQLTSGDKHHFFGYIGQCRTIPWNASNRYILGMEIDRIDRMPKPEDAATIFIIDTQNDNKIIRLDKTHAWNPQQGTMFYWNPLAPETQFFFNDRDVKTGKVFTVIYDIEKKKRVREYRFDDTPIGNGGVAFDGSAWLGINYGRLARLRLVTGYPEALDWSKNEPAPKNDGIFVIDIKSGKKRLLVSYHQLNEKLKEKDPGLEHSGLFINHTLWNRDATKVYFYARAGWKGHKKGKRVNQPFSINVDGTGLTLHETFIGGHPEWADNKLVIGTHKDEKGEKDVQVLYNVETKRMEGTLGNSEMFPKPGADISMSPNGNIFVNGYSESGKNYYAVLRRSDNAFARSNGIDKGEYSGDIRIDPAPRWNRTNDAILVPGIAKNGTRQMFVIRIIEKNKPQQQSRSQIKIEKNIVFGETINFKGQREKLLLDVYSSEKKQKNKPVFMLIHGGGFRYGNDKSQKYIVSMAERFAARGFVCVSVNYRVRENPRNDKKGTVNDALQDVMKGLNWIRKNKTKLGIDTTKIVVGGGSAGGILGANFCYRETIGNKKWNKNGIVAFVNLWGSPDSTWGSFIIDKTDPPTIIVHGTADDKVPFVNSQKLMHLLNKNGVNNKLVAIDGAGHTPASFMDSFEIEIARFLEEYIR